MPHDDLEKLSRLISEARRIAETRPEWATVVYLLELAAVEISEKENMPIDPPSPPKRPGSFPRRRRP